MMFEEELNLRRGKMLELETFDYLEDKKLSTTSSTFGLLRSELIRNLGVKRAKSFLLRYGWNLGKAHALEVLRQPDSVEKMLEKAGALHLQTGQISELISERKVIVNEQGEVAHIFATGQWVDSFEVQEHMKNHGMSDTAVCHTLTGFGSGFTSTITKRNVYLREVKCIAKGDDACEFEMRLLEEWQEPDMQEEIRMYEENRFIDELNDTYEQLLEKKEYIEKVSLFHNELTTKLTEGNSIETIVHTVQEALGIIVTIEDLDFRVRVSAGASEEEMELYYEEFQESLVETRSGKKLYASYNKTFKVDLKRHRRLVTPIIVQQKTIGYITFIYKGEQVYSENDQNFIQRAAVAAALYYLNEKTSLEALEVMKGYFFEQLLLKQYPSINSMVYRGYYLGIDFNEPFYLATLQCTSEHVGTNKVEFIDKIVQAISRYLEVQDYNLLITEKDGHVLLLLPKVPDLLFKLENIMKHLSLQFRFVNFRVGLSNETTALDMLNESIEESQIALRLNSKETIVSFEQANIVGSLINSQNMTIVRRLAFRELKPIFDLKEQKRDELLKTLYVFLMNGGNLQQSISDLSLSMSGLMYRITRIEELLNKNLRNPVTAYELLLMLDALRILGDIEF